MKRKWKCLVALLAILTLMCFGSIAVSAADNMVTVGVTGTYRQSEARSMLAMINEFRTGNDAWAWNSTDTEKVLYSDLGELTYDDELERAAMQRAAEVAILFSHTRPNGSKCFSVSEKSYGENIAAGRASAAATFEQWKEENYSYIGQGHRRNMLNAGFTSIGIGHIYYNGIHYWVQEFGRSAGSSGSAADNSEKTVSVDVKLDYIANSSVGADVTTLTIPFGSTSNLPNAVTRVQLVTEDPDETTWPERLSPVQVSCEWKSSDTGIISISSGKVYGNKVGNSSIATTIIGKPLTVPVTVSPQSISSAIVSLSSASFTYDGTAKKPAVASVQLGGKTLTAGTDYTVSYSDNTNAGTASVIVTGKNNYTGTASKTFQIEKANLSAYAVSDIPGQTYSGSKLTPAVQVASASKTLVKDRDYTVSYSGNINVGTATVTVAGAGNYTGTLQKQFAIAAADLRKGTIGSIADQSYTGKAIQPAITVKAASKSLMKGTDYKVSYSNNRKVGTATVTVTGIGNYQGTLTKSFKIINAVTPAKGKSVKDKTTGATYKITKAGTSKTATVEYTKPTTSKAVVTIPDTVVINHVTCKVTSVAANAFKNNKKIQRVTIGKNVTSIGKNAFYGCTKLQKVTIGSKVTIIGDAAFYGCTKLTSLTIGVRVSKIGARAFAKCTSLKKVTIPVAVSKIGSQAFYGCKNLKTITVKTAKLTAKTVGSKTFSGIYSKATFKVPAKKVSAYK